MFFFNSKYYLDTATHISFIFFSPIYIWNIFSVWFPRVRFSMPAVPRLRRWANGPRRRRSWGKLARRRQGGPTVNEPFARWGHVQSNHRGRRGHHQRKHATDAQRAGPLRVTNAGASAAKSNQATDAACRSQLTRLFDDGGGGERSILWNTSKSHFLPPLFS